MLFNNTKKSWMNMKVCAICEKSCSWSQDYHSKITTTNHPAYKMDDARLD